MLHELYNHIRHLHYGLALIVSLVLIGAALIAFGTGLRVVSLTASAAMTSPIASLSFPAPGGHDLTLRTLSSTGPLAAPITDQTLRILALSDADGAGPAISAAERQLLEDYARAHNLEPVWLLWNHANELAEALVNGRGDVIAGAEEAMLVRFADEIEYTLPWAVSRQALVMRNDGEGIESLSDLAGRRVVARRESAAWARLLELAAEQPELELIAAPDDLPMEKLLQRVALGQYDLAVADSAFLESFLPGKHDLRIAHELPGGRSHAWVLRRDDGGLRESFNRYLGRVILPRSLAEVRFEDLPEISERRELRVITYRSPGNFYLDEGGELRGFEYELTRKFARQHDLRVQMIVAPSQQDMLRWLLEGRGDMIAASIPASGIRPDPRLSLSRPYNYAAPLIVGRDGERPLIDARDLEGRRIVLPAGSPYLRVLDRYRERYPGVDIVEADANQTIDQILARVEAGVYDLTVVDSHKARSLLAMQDGLKTHFPVSEPLPHVWVMRSSDQLLKLAANEFIDSSYRRPDYNTLHTRYFDIPHKYAPLPEAAADALTVDIGLSPYDEVVRQSADEHGFDWRLIVAQMYQESRFNPNAESTAGAMGLMQILPTTADEIGLIELTKPEASIRAGVRYLHTLFDRFDADLAYEDRIWFSLAAYNAGFGRVQQARRQAKAMGLDPDRWFGHVEDAMLTLVHSTTCRCGQPVVYVREIRSRYHNYVRLIEAVRYALSNPVRVNRDT